MVTELQKERNFIGQTAEQRKDLENILKQRYEISDWTTNRGKGYQIRDKKNEKDIYFSPNSRLTLEKRYLEKGKKREIIEDVLDLFTRVSTNIAEADLKYNKNANIEITAEKFLESMIYKQFMPNTPTLCNAGRSLQQLSACFVLPVEDYLATDDIGQDPEKQGKGIFDTLRYMAMVHKSGGGTGFNFSSLRPRSDRISTTFGSSSGPTSFIKVYNAATDEVNQGGFRRGANMGILNYNHPDIFEFVSEKARNGSLINFNLSVGATNEFMDLVKKDEYFKLINPKGEKQNISLEKRIWKDHNLLQKGTPEYNELYRELNPSLVISEKGGKIINTYNNEEVGKLNENKEVLIRARKLFDYIVENAWAEGCPGISFLDRLEQNNKTPHLGVTNSTNPCGEQPLLPFEACNLGAINLSDCYKVVNGIKEVDYDKIGKRTDIGVHFLDNVIDMSKYPFQLIYGMVHGNRKIGLGMMGWAELLTQLGIPYDSEEAVDLANNISNFITEKGTQKSEELAKERGIFPYWKGSEWEKQGKKVRNATITTIAPNGTTGMIADCTGGIEPYFKIAFKKTCLDERELIYRNPLLEKELRERIPDKQKLEKILLEIQKKGSIQNIAEIPEDLKPKYKTAHDIAPEWHVKIQAAFQKGIHNAVSKTVNLPYEATKEDVFNIYNLAYKEGCLGITIFRDGCKQGVLSGLADNINIELVQKSVISSPVIEKKAQALKYRVKRTKNKDSLHVDITSDLYTDEATNKAYFIPDEIFQNRVPLGDARSVSFQQAGIDRTEILKGENPDYAELIKRWQSAFSNEDEGIGKKRIKSIEHAVGIILEDCLLRNGVVERDERTNQLYNVVRKKDLRKVKEGSEEYTQLLSQVRVIENGKSEIVTGTNINLGREFVCEDCGGTEYTFQAGCHHPTCTSCGATEGGGCG